MRETIILSFDYTNGTSKAQAFGLTEEAVESVCRSVLNSAAYRDKATDSDIMLGALKDKILSGEMLMFLATIGFTKVMEHYHAMITLEQIKSLVNDPDKED